MKMTTLKAFTLAETLITLGIIGVIAVLTLPNVMTSYKNKTYVATLQRLYNQLSDAGVAMIADSKVDSLAETSMTELDGVGVFLRKYLKVVKDCGVSEDNSNECVGSNYKSFDRSKEYTPAFKNKYCVTTNLGASICMDAMRYDPINGDFPGYINVIVDVNGSKKPNVLGRDLFGFEFYSDGKISEGYNILTHIHYCGDDIDDKGYASGCFSKIMHDGWKMDY